MAWDPLSPPGVNVAGNVPMTTITAGAVIAQSRPKGRILFSDPGKRHARELRVYGDDVLVVWKAHAKRDATEVVGGPAWAERRSIPVHGHVALHPDGRWLAGSGPLVGGYEANIHVVDRTTGALVERLPAAAPCAWTGVGRTLIAQTCTWESGKELVDPALVAAQPWVPRSVPGVEQTLRLDLDARRSAVLGARRALLRHAAVTPDGATLVCVADEAISAIDLATGARRWHRAYGPSTQTAVFGFSAFALSPDGCRVAAGGIASEPWPDLVVLDVATGETVWSRPLAESLASLCGHSNVHSLAWHPSGWLAVGNGAGWIFHVEPDTGTLRAYAVGKVGVKSLCFRGDELLFGTSDSKVRALPLLEDER